MIYFELQCYKDLHLAYLFANSKEQQSQIINTSFSSLKWNPLLQFHTDLFTNIQVTVIKQLSTDNKYNAKDNIHDKAATFHIYNLSTAI